MSLLERIARALAPSLRTPAEIKDLVKEEVAAARQALPINYDYDPNGEGYRKVGGKAAERNLMPVSQDLMLELAYYLYDTSGLVKRFVRDTKNFVLGDGIKVSVANDDEAGSAKRVVDEFWMDPINRLDLRLEKRVEFLGLLGEQCWPVTVHQPTGRVWMSYVDPSSIDTVLTVKQFPEIPAAVKLKGTASRTGETLAAIRQETDPRKKEYGRRVGDCFYFAVNNPPNGPRGRSDLLHSFDFIENFEEGLFDELDRIRQLKAFVWDVELQGADEAAIREFLDKNPPPKPGSVRAHNERVKWNAVAPNLQAADNRSSFELMKSYLAAINNRPDSWLGSGGKAYQKEAELMGMPTMKDLASRSRYVKYMLEEVLQFVLDQAILAGRLRESPAAPLRAVVDMPATSKKDTKDTLTGLDSLARSLVLATERGWLSSETAARLYASVASTVGVDIDAAQELEKIKLEGDDLARDYDDRDDLIQEILAKIENVREAA